MKKCKNVDVVIIACRIECGFCHDSEILISASSTPKIPVGTNCAEAIAMLLTKGFEIINTETLQNSKEIVHTFAKLDNED